jgi:hypothetical protein
VGKLSSYPADGITDQKHNPDKNCVNSPIREKICSGFYYKYKNNGHCPDQKQYPQNFRDRRYFHHCLLPAIFLMSTSLAIEPLYPILLSLTQDSLWLSLRGGAKWFAGAAWPLNYLHANKRWRTDRLAWAKLKLRFGVAWSAVSHRGV